MVARTWFGMLCIGLMCAAPSAAQEAPDDLAPETGTNTTDGAPPTEAADDEAFGGAPPAAAPDRDAPPDAAARAEQAPTAQGPDHAAENQGQDPRTQQGDAAHHDHAEDGPVDDAGGEDITHDDERGHDEAPNEQDEGEFDDTEEPQEGPGLLGPLAGTAVGVALMGLFGAVVGGASGLNVLLGTLQIGPAALVNGIGAFAFAGMCVGCLTLPAGLGAGVNLTANAVSGYSGSYLYSILGAYIAFYGLGVVMLAANIVAALILTAIIGAALFVGISPNALGPVALIGGGAVSTAFGLIFTAAVPAVTAGVWYATANAPYGEDPDYEYEDDYDDEFEDDYEEHGYEDDEEPFEDRQRAFVATPRSPARTTQAY